MLQLSQLTKSFYKIGEVASMLGVTPKTVQNYANAGRIQVDRTEGGHRRIRRDCLIEFLYKKGILFNDSNVTKRDIIYARVSSHEQKAKGDLDRQVARIVESVPNLQNPLVLKEVGSGLNDSRKELLKVIDLVLCGSVNKVYVTYRDRLTRFGYRYLEVVFLSKGVTIVVTEKNKIDKNTQEELVEDMMSLIASFSGKLYGMRSHKNRRKFKEGESCQR